MNREDIIEINEKTKYEKINSVLEGGDILKIKDDRTFKILFNSLNTDAINWFMSKMLDKPIDKVKGRLKEKNTALKPLNLNDKGKYVDFLVEVDNDLVVVELNNNSEREFDYTRNLYYTFHALLNQIEKGEKYHRIHALLVNLNWYKENEDISGIKPVEIIKYPYPRIGYENKESIITVKNINLSFFDKVEYNGVEMKDFLWKLFTINKSSCLEDVKSNIKELKDYCSELKRISGSEEYCMHVWSDRLEKAFNIDYQNGKENGFELGKEEGIRLGKEEGIKLGKEAGIKLGKEEGIKLGKEEGIIEGKKEIVINLYQKEIPVDTISEYTNLTIDEIKNIIELENSK